MNKQKKRLYLAGKISGLPEADVRTKFARAEDIYSELGFEVINPFQKVKEEGFDTCPWNKIMRVCLTHLLACDAVVMLHDWQESPGAMLEYDMARKVNMPIFHYFENIDGLIKLLKS